MFVLHTPASLFDSDNEKKRKLALDAALAGLPSTSPPRPATTRLASQTKPPAMAAGSVLGLPNNFVELLSTAIAQALASASY